MSTNRANGHPPACVSAVARTTTDCTPTHVDLADIGHDPAAVHEKLAQHGTEGDRGSQGEGSADGHEYRVAPVVDHPGQIVHQRSPPLQRLRLVFPPTPSSHQTDGASRNYRDSTEGAAIRAGNVSERWGGSLRSHRD